MFSWFGLLCNTFNIQFSFSGAVIVGKGLCSAIERLLCSFFWTICVDDWSANAIDIDIVNSCSSQSVRLEVLRFWFRFEFTVLASSNGGCSAR